MADREPPLSAFADHVDILCCNRGEWESLADREQVAWRVSILAVTDGSNGATIRFTTPEGDPGLVEVPAFPRGRPPLDTNRAGEAFASTLVKTLMDAGWRPGVTSPDLASQATSRGSAAAALVLDRGDFGFPTPDEIDEAIRDGRVP
jgi:ribokinase